MGGPNRTRTRWRVPGLVLLASAASAGPCPPAWPAGAPAGLSIVAVAPRPASEGAAMGRWVVYLDGVIDDGAPGRFAQLLERESIADAEVYFNSPGGSLLAAMALGRLLRDRGFDSNVGARTAVDLRAPGGGVCYSACPIAFAGGVDRRLRSESLLGIHRAQNRVPVPDEVAFQELVSRQLAEYLALMGIDGRLSELMLRVPHRAIRVLTPEEARALGLLHVGFGSG